MDYDRAAEPLIAALADAEPTVRAAVAEALGRLKTRAAFDQLVKLLANPDADVRLSAANAIGRLGDSRAIEPLAKLIGKGDLKFQMGVSSPLKYGFFRLSFSYRCTGRGRAPGDDTSRGSF